MNDLQIDLNLDAGESAAALADGSEEALYELVSSANIACGGHTGDRASMRKSVELALKHALRIGAHPSYPDKAAFGRKPMALSRGELSDSLTAQIESLRKVCVEQGTKLKHVKPHGALYNTAAANEDTAEALIGAVKRVDSSLKMMGLAGSMFLDWCQQAGLQTIAEAFSDRRYEENGTLRGRQHMHALITKPQEAAEQALRIVRDRRVIAVTGNPVHLEAQTICIHGDTPGALAMAQAVRATLTKAGIRITASLSKT